MKRFKSALFYLLLVVACYLIAVSAGSRLAFIVFLAAAIFWELLFWKVLLFGPKRR